MKKQPNTQTPLSRFHVVAGSRWRKLCRVEKGDYVETELHNEIRAYGGIFLSDAFIPLWNKTTGVLFLSGGYASSKTTYVITRLLVKCMDNKRFKCFYGRQAMTEVRTSIHSNILYEIERNGWNDLFEYSKKPTGSMEILCKANGNKFVAFGCDDEASMKGWDNPTDVFIDEVNNISFSAFGMMLTRLRSPGAELQLSACFNNCDVFPDHWLKRYFYNEEEIEDESIKEAIGNMEVVKHHSTYKDNMFINQEQYLSRMIMQAGKDPARIAAIVNGDWGVAMNAQPFYKNFDSRLHVASCEYNPSLPLHVSWDENVNPYLPVGIFQIQGLNVYMIDEIAAENPYNTLRWVCNEICKRYGRFGKDHKAGMFVYGDATSRKDDVKQEKGKDFFRLAAEYLAEFHPKLRVGKSNPNVAMRGNFMNAVLRSNYGGIFLTFSPNCKKMIADLMNIAEAPDGTKDKTKVLVNGIRAQRWGHFSDLLDYLCCECFQKYYLLFQSAGKKPVIHVAQRVSHNAF